MPYPHLAKSLLALAIASTSLQSQADTYNIGNGPLEYENEVISQSLTITGSLTTGEDAVELADGTHLQGDLILDAQITVNGPQEESGNFASVVDISGDDWGDAVQIDGQVINKGSLNASGLMAQGITIEYADIEGGVVNEGSITITNGIDLNDGIIEGNPSGIFIQNANIDGQVRNNGQIKVAGNAEADATGIQILDSDLAEAAIVNSTTGSIEVSGEEARGFDISQVSIQSLENAGSITATGTDEALGIWLEDVAAGAVSNSGTITVTNQAGGDATGIKLDDSSLASLSNTGSIQVDAAIATGIIVKNSEIAGSLTNSGSILASGADSTAIAMGGTSASTVACITVAQSKAALSASTSTRPGKHCTSLRPPA